MLTDSLVKTKVFIFLICLLSNQPETAQSALIRSPSMQRGEILGF